VRLQLFKILLFNKHTKLNIKMFINKSSINPMWTYGLQLWGNAKKSNLNKIQTHQNKILPSITIAPPYISNLSLHLKIKTIHEESKTSYERIFNKLPSHPNPIIAGLATHTIPGNPPHRLKRNWCRDLLND